MNQFTQVDQMVECNHLWRFSSANRHNVFYRCVECNALDVLSNVWADDEDDPWQDKVDMLRHRQWVNAKGEIVESVLWLGGGRRFAIHRVLVPTCWDGSDIPF